MRQARNWRPALASTREAWDVEEVRNLSAMAGWRFVTGLPDMRCMLIHEVVDVSQLLRGTHDCRVHASVRLRLLDGRVHGATVSSTTRELDAALSLFARFFASRDWANADFLSIQTLLAGMFIKNGLVHSHACLLQNATVLPRPVLDGGQLVRMALAVVNRRRTGDGVTALTCLPPELVHVIHDACSTEHPAVRHFLAQFDPTALALVNHFVHRPPDRCGLALLHYLDSQAHGKFRHQAVTVAPWLIPMLTSVGSEADKVRAAIDAGQPLHDAVARACDVQREAVRWLAQCDLPDDWLLDFTRLRKLLRLLSWIAPERRPRRANRFAAQIAGANALVALLGFHEQPETDEILCLYRSPMQRWLGEIAALDAVAREGMLAALADARDFLRAVHEAFQSRDRVDVTAAMLRVIDLCAGLPLARLARLSARWHEQIAVARPVAADSDYAHWNKVLLAPLRYETITVTELASCAQLREEGSRMQHCVSSYAARCIHGNSIILSLRSLDDGMRSTAELLIDWSGAGVSVAQHRGPRNALPAAACEAALAQAVRHLRGASMMPALAAVHAQRQRDASRWKHGAGRAADDWQFDSHAREAALRLVEP